MTAANRVSAPGHVPGLDAIRFLMAFWVLVFHYHVPIPPVSASAAAYPLVVLARNAFAGGAAVMVFFVISGFCIHYPFRDAPPELLPYYARRHLRILVPVAFALLLAAWSGWGATRLLKTTLWSLICEEIYYTIYPALWRLRQRVSWMTMAVILMVGSWIVPLALGLTPQHRWGVSFNWITLLPVWLVGCWFAEQVDRLPASAPSAMHLWATRLGLWGYTFVAGRLHGHTPISIAYTWSLIAFPAAYWLGVEIRQAKYGHRLWFDRAGAWSYSLYLVHNPIRAAIGRFAGVPVDTTPLLWLVSVAIALLVAYGFYLVIERPSHQLARRFARRVAAWSLDGMAPSAAP